MKKQLLSLALAAVIAPAFSVSAQGTLTEIWRYVTDEYTAEWDSEAPNWSSANEIKGKSCTRFAHGRDGKLYTINMKTMSIAEITKDGFKDLYKLPALDDGGIYGTALSMDDAGNFLIGHNFTKAPDSSTKWSIYQPSTGKIKHFDLGVPDDYSVMLDGTEYSGIGRIDVVGRVIGDMTTGATFYIGPQSKFAQCIRIVTCFGDGDVDHANMVSEKTAGVYMGSPTQHCICQPKYSTIDEIRMHAASDGFYFASTEGGKWDVVGTFINGAADYSFQNVCRANARAKTNGFDTFVVEGRRYFVKNYLAPEDPATGLYTMDIAVFNENGQIAAKWHNPDYEASNGYATITCEPIEDGSVNIYLYASTTGGVKPTLNCSAAAMVNFKPLSAAEMPGSETNPIRITNPQELIDMRNYLNVGDNYILLENDIDMSNVGYTVPLTENDFGKKIHFDGQYHVIKNLTVEAGNASLFGSLSGEVRNLGLEDVNLNVKWFCVGGIAGAVNEATIDNCYVTGYIRGAASGGLVGSNLGALTITNCYSSATVTDDTGSHCGGLVGRIDADLTLANAYCSGSVTGSGQASGIATIRNSNFVNLKNVVAWNPEVSGEIESGFICAGGGFLEENVYNWDGLELKGEKLGFGETTASLQAIVTGWDAFSTKLVNDMPVLKWQNGEVGSVEGIVADEAVEAAPVYYNLQGIRVANPENGIYIVRRGSKVTKEYIR